MPGWSPAKHYKQCLLKLGSDSLLMMCITVQAEFSDWHLKTLLVLLFRAETTQDTFTVSSWFNWLVPCTWYKYGALIGWFVSRGAGPVS